MLNTIIKTVLAIAVVAATAPAIPITSMSPTQGPVINADQSGGSGFTFPAFNGGEAVFDQVKEDLRVFFRYNNSESWSGLDGNAESGWVYDQNWGHFWEGGGGFWFHVERTTYIRLQSAASSSVYLDYTIVYDVPDRVGNNLSAKDGLTTITADNDGNLGVQFPLIGGSPTRSADIEKFVYEIKTGNVWVELSNSQASAFYWAANGYNNMSDKNQWSIWYEGGGGVWFRPIQQNYQFRIGYPSNGIKGGAINNNYVEYSFVGNPNAPRPDLSALGSIQLGTSANSGIAGWRLIWNDEFNGNSLDRSKWDYDVGYYLSDDPGTWGWGNNELQHYTDSEKNNFVENGNLNLKAFANDPKTFPQGGTANYSSGKVVTRDKFAFKYGRIDFRAKLPAGTGMWPALWMLPRDEAYGGWAASGEIDVMEARGRLPGETSGTVHFGGGWPNNVYVGADYNFENGQRIDTDFHVYSAVWEEDNIKWYVDGKCFSRVTNQQWRSDGAPGNNNAPFDQDFFIIMNLALGGNFDGGKAPSDSDLPATMQVDYVRVYKADAGVTPIRGGKKNDSRLGIKLTNNIVSQRAEISVKTPEAASINLAVYDNAGNVVFEKSEVKNDDRILWNLTNSQGRKVANGTYLIVVEAKSANGKIYRYSEKIGVKR